MALVVAVSSSSAARPGSKPPESTRPQLVWIPSLASPVDVALAFTTVSSTNAPSAALDAADEGAGRPPDQRCPEGREWHHHHHRQSRISLLAEEGGWGGCFPISHLGIRRRLEVFLGVHDFRRDECRVFRFFMGYYQTTPLSGANLQLFGGEKKVSKQEFRQPHQNHFTSINSEIDHHDDGNVLIV